MVHINSGKDGKAKSQAKIITGVPQQKEVQPTLNQASRKKPKAPPTKPKDPPMTDEEKREQRNRRRRESRAAKSGKLPKSPKKDYSGNIQEN